MNIRFHSITATDAWTIAHPAESSSAAETAAVVVWQRVSDTPRRWWARTCHGAGDGEPAAVGGKSRYVTGTTPPRAPAAAELSAAAATAAAANSAHQISPTHQALSVHHRHHPAPYLVDVRRCSRHRELVAESNAAEPFTTAILPQGDAAVFQRQRGSVLKCANLLKSRSEKMGRKISSDQ